MSTTTNPILTPVPASTVPATKPSVLQEILGALLIIGANFGPVFLHSQHATALLAAGETAIQELLGIQSGN
jgi:predicted phage tail protein